MRARAFLTISLIVFAGLAARAEIALAPLFTDGLVPALKALTAAADTLDLTLDPSDEADRLAGIVDDPLNPAP